MRLASESINKSAGVPETKSMPMGLVLFCFFANLLCLEVNNPYLPLYLKSLSNVPMESLASLSAMALSAPMLGVMLFSPLWGKLSDKLGSKKMVIRASLALSISQLLTGLCQTPESLIATRFFQGVFAGFITAMQTYVLVMCADSKKNRMLARMQSAKAVATSLGAVIGGFLLAYLPYQAVYFVASTATLMVTLLIWRRLPADIPTPRVPKTKKTSTSVGMECLFVLVLILLAQVAKFIPNASFAFYAENLCHHQAYLIGLLYAAPGLMIIISAEFTSRLFDSVWEHSKRLGQDKPVFLYFSLLSGFAVTVLTLQSLTQSIAAIFICRLLWGAVLSALLPGLTVYLSERSKNKGVMLGIANSVTKLGNFSGVFLGAYVVGFIRLEQVFLLMAGVYSLISLGSLIYALRFTKLKFAQEVVG